MLQDNENQIGFYTREFYPLNNFSALSLIYNDLYWPTGEHLYQALKFDSPELQEKIRLTTSPDEAKDTSHSHKENWRPDHKENQLERMEKVLRLKLEQHQQVRDLLLGTGDRDIIEDSPIDAYWGWGPNKDGENQLGKIWMKLRDQLNNNNAENID